MKLTKLHEGLIVSNYRKLCYLLEEKVKSGQSKQIQLNKWSEYFTYHKEGNKIIIDNILTNEKEVELQDGRSIGNNKGCGKNIKKLLSFGISYEDMNKKGIYAITLDNKIYIGSTTVSFLDRYGGHKQKYNKIKTREMLEQGAVFSILQVCEEDITEEQIRTIEDQWIKEYRNNPKWEVVNILENVSIKGKHAPKKVKTKVKTKTIKVSEEDYARSIEILTSLGIKII